MELSKCEDYTECLMWLIKLNKMKGNKALNMNTNHYTGNTDFVSLNVFSVSRVFFLPDSINTIENCIASIFYEINWD